MNMCQPKVLIIDDQPTIRRLLTEILEDEGYNVLAAANGYDGLQLACDTNPDVILMDIKMPGMNGVDVLREIKRKGRNDKVIIMTAYGELETINKIKEEGALEYITKPFDIKTLCKTIENVINVRIGENPENLMIG